MSPKKGKPLVTSTDQKAAVGSLQKGLALVEILLDSQAPTTLTELAAQAGFDVSSTHRLLQVLMELGYVVREEVAKRYVPGPRALSPLKILHPLNEFRRTARPILESLRDTSGQTTSLIAFVGNERITVDVARGAHQLVPFYDTWLKSPLHASATGKILIAWKTDEERQNLLGPGPFKPYSSGTITDPILLNESLAQVREQHYAVGRDEPYLGITSIAAPFAHSNKIIGCIAVTARSDAIPEAVEKQIGFALRTSASLLSHSGPDLRSFFYLFNPNTPFQQLRSADEISNSEYQEGD